MIVVLLLVILWVVCAGFAALIAHNKGRSVGGFAVAGLLLGVFGLLWAAFAAPASQRTGAGSFAADRQRGERLRQHQAEDQAMVKRQRLPD